MTKAGLTSITVVLDRSGSMASSRKGTIEGYNEFLGQQKAEPGEVTLSLVQFDDRYEVNFIDKPLGEVEDLTYATFVPRGMTALHDAIGRSIVDVGRALAARAEDDRPEKVVFVIITDGGENSSSDYTAEVVATLTKQQTDQYQWQFIFLGANQDAVLTASTLGIAKGSSMSYNSTNTGTHSVFAATSGVVKRFRGGPGGQSVSFSDEDRDEVAKA